MAASGINSVAGGGSLISFPTLHFAVGIPSVPANATNAVALWPGSLAAALSGKEHLTSIRPHLVRMIIPTLVGSALGALLLTVTPQRVFDLIVPVLIALAASTLAFQPKIKAWASARSEHRGTSHLLPPFAAAIVQFIVAVYGGYFGAGIGILMLGAFALTLEASFHEINAAKNFLAVLVNVTATVVFIAQGLVLWLPLACMAVGATLGGYTVGNLAKRLDPNKMRVAVSIYGFFMAAYFAYKAIG